MTAHRTRFRAVIYRQGIQRVVNVPDEVAEGFAEWDFPPVIVNAAGAERATTLVPRAGGGLRLFLHDQLRKAAGVDTGETIDLAVRIDDGPVLPIPDDMMHMAAGVEGGVDAVVLLPPGLRRQMLDFLDGAKRPETRRKRLARLRELIVERAARLANDG